MLGAGAPHNASNRGMLYMDWRVVHQSRLSAPVPAGCDGDGALPVRCLPTQILRNRCGPHDRAPRNLWTNASSADPPSSCDDFSTGAEERRHSRLKNSSTTASKNRVAVCITGQLRGLPVAVLNWQMGSLFRLLRAGGLALDIFLVTSQSKSFDTWWPFVQSQLRPVRVVVLNPTLAFNSTSSASEGWAVRNLSSHVQFNLDAFPWFENHKYGTVLVQHYQMDWCRTIIAEQEQRVTHVPYLRVARLRSDLIFSGLPKWHARRFGCVGKPRRCGGEARAKAAGFPTAASENASAYQKASGAYLACRLGGQAGTASRVEAKGEAWGDAASARCAAALAEERAELVRSCQRHIASMDRADHWLTGSDLWFWGSRDVAMDYMSGLQILQEARRRAGAGSLRVEQIQKLWTIIASSAAWTHNASGAAVQRRVLSGGPCAIATADTDLVRTSGSTMRIFFQFSESMEVLEPCLRQMSLAECMRAQEARWAVPYALLRECFALNYDFALGWNASCSAENLVSDLVRFHARGFGADLVGDVSGWAKHKMSTAQWDYRHWVTGRTPANDGF